VRVTTVTGAETIGLGVGRAFPGELDGVLDVLARRFRVPVPASAAPRRLYTVQLLAARDADRATAFARSLDEDPALGDPSEGFWDGCLPCSTPGARVIDAEGARLHRVVVGLYADRRSARRARDAIRRSDRRAFVRRL